MINSCIGNTWLIPIHDWFMLIYHPKCDKQQQEMCVLGTTYCFHVLLEISYIQGGKKFGLVNIINCDYLCVILKMTKFFGGTPCLFFFFKGVIQNFADMSAYLLDVFVKENERTSWCEKLVVIPSSLWMWVHGWYEGGEKASQHEKMLWSLPVCGCDCVAGWSVSERERESIMAWKADWDL